MRSFSTCTLHAVLPLAVASALFLIPTADAQAGLIPWSYNAIFGYGPAFPGYRYGYGAGYAPMAGYGYPVTANYGYPVTTNYGYPGYSIPATSYYGPVTGAYDAYGYDYGYGGTECCNPCPSACDPCGSGNCASGNCGAGYNPDTQPSDIGNSPNPTEAQPEPVTPDVTPPTYRDNAPPDNFVPATPRENDSTIPGNGSSSPGSRSNSTIPDNDRSNSTIPPRGSGSNGNNAPDFDDFSMPNTERSPAPLEPSGSTIPKGNNRPEGTPAPGGNSENEVLPLGTQVEPVDVESAPLASLSAQRRRIVSQAGYRIPHVTRMNVAPRTDDLLQLVAK